MRLGAPAVEIADDRHPARVRRPHREMNPGDAVRRMQVRAEFVVQPEVPALLEQINIVLGEQADALLHRLDVSRSGIFGGRCRHTGFSWLQRREPIAAT